MVRGIEIEESEDGEITKKCSSCGDELDSFEDALDHFDDCNPIDHTEKGEKE